MAAALPFEQSIADEICDRLIAGESLRKITLSEHMPAASTIFKWLATVPKFAEQYARARDAQADTLADEILDIADDGSNDWMGGKDEESGSNYNGDAVARSKLRVDARKWIAAKLKPKKYGEKTLLGSDPDNPLPDSFAVKLVKPRAEGD
jgi:hypothetical protein